ncbi:Bilirubin oxidase [Beutenbergia cavernae DSM 12333]|uniref:Multicopper oxidase CueO n=1 Tax=Beutenbergia cavernae (strain ATCC BAA-8 / DSM 12333 / CCUG 43141 / JCM 11478 / NBRC 16432 / NCIMB 13614 / HKI 0122) TaxID=471853 RepID=C5C5A6_BEUC1|nr:multicopper oxidase domain-containing protein [Beutenbergia cavernae]ACQ82246.1 Bilirubin oxidase [Beutenbergia cavernae DSM 12333]
MRLSRRTMLGLMAGGTAVGTAAVVSGCSFAGGAFDGPRDEVGQVPLTTPLAIPPLAPSEMDDDGVRTFALTARPGSREFLPGTTTATMGYDGDYLGPTLRAKRGEQVRVRARNELDAETTVHFHGMHLPAIMDGGPHQRIPPGGERTPTWAIRQHAATLWYHPHPHGATEGQVTAGLAGLFILDDDEEAALDLPRDYGVDDVPVIVQDMLLGDDGASRRENGRFVGTLGNTLIVNGIYGPYLDVTTQRVRLRILNASGARIYGFEMSDGRDLVQIASDGGLLAAPHATRQVVLSPAERAEVIVELQPGETVVLRSEPYEFDDGPGGMIGRDDRFDVLELRAAATLTPSPAVPAALAAVEKLRVEDVTQERSMEFSGTSINGQDMDMGRIDEVVTIGATEIWNVRNDNGSLPHNVHVHDVQFQVLTIDGAAPPPPLAGWKDTVLLLPEVEYRLIMRFTDYADPAVPYMYHCHLLWHEDQGMMGQFVVVEPGQEPIPPTDDGAHAHH